MPTAKSIVSLMGVAEADRDLQWLKDSLQTAINLEFATLPPYLIARWSIKNVGDPVAQSIGTIYLEEMLHFGLACNLLVAIGGSPVLNAPESVPDYPGGLPGGVHPGLTVGLKRLTKSQAKVFMDIEYPQGGPVAFLAAGITFASIGEFYDAVLAAFEQLNPDLSLDRQIDEAIVGLFRVDTFAKVREAIELIKQQGEGSNMSPEDTGPDDLAHYYRFAEIYHGKKVVKDPTTGEWRYNGADVPLPDTWPMADIPPGGYQQSDVPDAATWELIERFDRQFTEMLDHLQAAWQTGSDDALSEAVSSMYQMRGTAMQLIKKPLPSGGENYGPCFRLLRGSSTALSVTTLQELRLLPPLAIGRFGSSMSPMDNYDVVSDSPTGYRRLVSASTPLVDRVTGEIMGQVVPTSVMFRDDSGKIRPVAPFLELWGRFDASDSLEPVTTAHLTALGPSTTDVKWRVHAANVKAFRRTGNAADQISVDTGEFDDHAVHFLDGGAANFKTAKAIRFGDVQYIKPTTAHPQIRLRFTPAAGKVFGPTAGDPNIADDVYDAAAGGWDEHTDDLPVPPGEPPRTIPQFVYAQVRSGPSAGVSLAYLDDSCDAWVEVSLLVGGRKLTSFARVSSGPPDFAPDSFHVRTLADDLEQAVHGPAATTAVSADQVRDIVRRALDTVRLINTSYWNSVWLRRMASDPTSFFPAQATWEHVEQQHRILLDALQGLDAPSGSAQRNQAVATLQFVRAALREYTNVGHRTPVERRKMPPLMRGSEGQQLALTRRQLALIDAAITQFSGPDPARMTPEQAMLQLIADLSFGAGSHTAIPVAPGVTLNTLFANPQSLLNYLLTNQAKGALAGTAAGQDLVTPGQPDNSAFVALISRPTHPMNSIFSGYSQGAKDGIQIVREWIASLP